MNPAQWLVRTALLTPQAPALFKGARLEADYAEFLHRVAALIGRMRGLAELRGLMASFGAHASEV